MNIYAPKLSFIRHHTYIRLTTFTRPNSASVAGVASFAIFGASSDSVRLALITSEPPSGEGTEAIIETPARYTP